MSSDMDPDVILKQIITHTLLSNTIVVKVPNELLAKTRVENTGVSRVIEDNDEAETDKETEDTSHRAEVKVKLKSGKNVPFCIKLTAQQIKISSKDKEKPVTSSLMVHFSRTNSDTSDVPANKKRKVSTSMVDQEE